MSNLSEAEVIGGDESADTNEERYSKFIGPSRKVPAPKAPQACQASTRSRIDLEPRFSLASGALL